MCKLFLTMHSIKATVKQYEKEKRRKVDAVQQSWREAPQAAAQSCHKWWPSVIELAQCLLTKLSTAQNCLFHILIYIQKMLMSSVCTSVYIVIALTTVLYRYSISINFDDIRVYICPESNWMLKLQSAGQDGRHWSWHNSNACKLLLLMGIYIKQKRENFIATAVLTHLCSLKQIWCYITVKCVHISVGQHSRVWCSRQR